MPAVYRYVVRPLIGVLVVLVLVANADQAEAGEATISQCQSISGAHFADVALTKYDSRPSWLGVAGCTPYFPYMSISSYGRSGANPAADTRAITFEPPGDTYFSGIKIHRQMKNYAFSSDSTQRPYDSWGLGYRLTDASGSILESCGAAVTSTSGAGQCANENYLTVLPSDVFSRSGLHTKQLNVQFGCFHEGYCAHFYSYPEVGRIYADFSVVDGNAPVIEQATGSLASSDGPITTDNDDLTVSATDRGGLGVAGLRSSIDGSDARFSKWTGQANSCDDVDDGSGFAYLSGQPCATTPPALEWELPTVSDGQHMIRVDVVDAAGNASLALARTVTLDRLPPVLNQDPKVAGEPVVGKSLQCAIDGVDAQDPRFDFQWVRALADGSDAQVIGGATSATYQLTAVDAGSKLLCRVTVSDRGGSTARTSALTSGPFDGGQTVAPGIGTGSGSSAPAPGGAPNGSAAGSAGQSSPATTGPVSLGTSAASTAGPSGPGSSQGPGAPAPGCPVGTLVTLEGSSRIVAKRSTSGTSIAGVVRSGTGAPAAGIAVDLVQRVRRSGVAPSTVSTGVSGADGRFSLKAPIGPSRDLQVVTRSCGASGPVVGQSVRGQVKLRAVNPRVRNGQSVRFSGQALGGYYGKGVGLELQVLVGRKWQDVRAVRTDRNGRFRTSYRFKRTYVRFTYRFRVITRATAGWPYTATRSPITKVRVN